MQHHRTCFSLYHITSFSLGVASTKWRLSKFMWLLPRQNWSLILVGIDASLHLTTVNWNDRLYCDKYHWSLKSINPLIIIHPDGSAISLRSKILKMNGYEKAHHREIEMKFHVNIFANNVWEITFNLYGIEMALTFTSVNMRFCNVPELTYYSHESLSQYLLKISNDKNFPTSASTT